MKILVEDEGADRCKRLMLELLIRSFWTKVSHVATLESFLSGFMLVFYRNMEASCIDLCMEQDRSVVLTKADTGTLHSAQGLQYLCYSSDIVFLDAFLRLALCITYTGIILSGHYCLSLTVGPFVA
jgi:hypothetical protein